MRIFFFFFFWGGGGGGGSKSASTDWSRNSKRHVASRRKLAPRRLGRVVRALDSIPEFESHSQQFEIQGHDL